MKFTLLVLNNLINAAFIVFLRYVWLHITLCLRGAWDCWNNCTFFSGENAIKEVT